MDFFEYNSLYSILNKRLPEKTDVNKFYLDATLDTVKGTFLPETLASKGLLEYMDLGYDDVNYPTAKVEFHVSQTLTYIQTPHRVFVLSPSRFPTQT